MMKNICSFISLLISGFALILMSGCEQSRAIPFQPDKEYEPHLMIFGGAGPHTGARVIVGYNRPFYEMPGVVPPIPDLSVIIKGETGDQFILREDSVGYYSLPEEELVLIPDVKYYLKVENTKSKEVYLSSKVMLPEKPKILEFSADETMSDRVVLAKVTLEEPSQFILGIAYHFYRLDSIGHDMDKRDPYRKIIPEYFSFKGEGQWTSLDFIQWINNDTWSEETGEVRMSYIEAEVIYVSEELARFFFEQRESDFFGEDIFQPVRPIYSNISGNHGIFGLFNETTARIELE